MELSETRAVTQTKIKEVFEIVCANGASTNIRELSELLFEEYNHMAAWSAWKIVLEDIYFHGTPDKLQAYAPERVKQYFAERKAAAVSVSPPHSTLYDLHTKND
jgi:hypothetical protein